MLTIRKARLSDLPSILPLWQELTDHHSRLGRRNRKVAAHLVPPPAAARRFAAWVTKNLKSGNGVMYLATLDGDPAGYCFAFIKRNPFNPIVRLGQIDHLLVKKKYRKRGISSALSREAIAWFRRKGIRRLCLYVLECNRTPQAIYRKWGFVSFVVEMRKNLS